MFRDIPNEIIGEENGQYRWSEFFKSLIRSIREIYFDCRDIPIHKEYLEYWLKLLGKDIKIEVEPYILIVGSDQKVIDWDEFESYTMKGVDVKEEMKLLDEVGVCKNYVLYRIEDPFLET
jgi:hypothetical protein